jgi:hypothetical protein
MIRGRRSLSLVVLASCSFGASGCGGDDASPGGGGAGAPGAGSNVTFAEACTVPPACGGDPTGEWTFLDGCVEPPPEGFECAEGVRMGRGTAEGTYTFEAGNYSIDLDSELRQCGWIDGSSSGSSGSYTVTGSTLMLGPSRTVSFCVEGDTLSLHDAAAEYSALTVLRLRRAPPANR